MAKFSKPPAAPGKEHLFSYHLHKFLAHKRPARGLEHIHASDVTKPEFCARRFALMDKCNVSGKDDYITTAMKLVYFQGEIMESGLQRWAAQIGIAVGDWKCGGCGHLHEFSTKPALCSNCAFNKFSYSQVRPVSQDSGISCGLDLLLKLPGLDKVRIVEAKTYPKDEFQSLSSALSEHRDRTRLYMRCSAEDPRYADKIDTEMAHVFYVSKGGFGQKSDLPKKWGIKGDGAWSPFKEFLLKANHEASEEYAQKARPLWHYKKTGTMCAGICSTGFDKHAQNCEVLKECFSGQHPPGK